MWPSSVYIGEIILKAKLFDALLYYASNNQNISLAPFKVLSYFKLSLAYLYHYIKNVDLRCYMQTKNYDKKLIFEPKLLRLFYCNKITIQLRFKIISSVVLNTFSDCHKKSKC